MPFENRVKLRNGELGVIECGLVVKHENFVIGVPLVSVTAEVDITVCAAEVKLTQTYLNNSETPLNCIFFFPTEASVAIHSFTATLGERKLRGIVKNKDVAREEFVEAVAKGKSAFLLEEVKPDILELMIGNLEPDTKCTIEVGYLQELPYQELQSRFTLPTSIAPRYVPTSEPNPVFEQMNLQYTADIPLYIAVRIAMRSEIRSVSSPSHVVPVELERTGDWYRASTALNGVATNLDRDFVLIIDCDDPSTPIVVVEEATDEIAVMMSFVPDTNTPDKLCEFVFLVDCSGSMGGMGGAIKKAREAMKIFMQSLPEDCYFNIFRFGSTHESLYQNSKKYDDGTLKEAKQYIAEVSANLGGTEILEPINVILEDDGPAGYEKQVLLLTDGQVSNTHEVIDAIKAKSRGSRVFSLGIGNYASRELVTGMAEAGRGMHMFCAEMEPMHEKVIRMLALASSGRAEITAVEESGGDKLNFLSPEFPISLFTGEKVTMFGLLPSLPETITVHFSNSKGNKNQHIIHQSSFVRIETGKFHKLAAFKVATGGLVGEDVSEAVALKYQVVTKDTSFICVDDQDAKVSAAQTVPRLTWDSSDSDDSDDFACSAPRSRLCSDTRSRGPSKGMSFGFSNPFKWMFRTKKKSKGSAMRGDDSSIGRGYSQGDFAVAEASTTTASKSTVTESELLTKLLDLSDIKGRFSDLEKVRMLCEVVRVELNNFAEDVIATALALVLLETRFSLEQDTWYLVARKVEKWLRSQISEHELKKLKMDLKSIIST